ncbi:hypothetical protein ACFYR1_49305 [Streptomyces canus]|uniref:hypothetical protein n=1 Tax=Streptomyces canus TaxID=58343 RepID=UPI0036852CFA
MDPLMAFLRQPNALPSSGWRQPEFTGWRDEQMSWKTTCSLGDWSFLWDLVIEGPQALEFLQYYSVNDLVNFEIGRAKHLVQVSERGNIVAEGVVMRLAENRYSMQSSPAFYSAYRLSRGDYDVQWHQQDTFQYQVSGPNALTVCARVTGESLTDIKFMRFREVTIAGKRVLALRQGMAGEIGFEFHGAAEDKEAVWDAILEAGGPEGIRRIGSRTVMTNHLEAAFPTGNYHYLYDTFDLPGFMDFVMANFDLDGAPQVRGSLEGDVSAYVQTPYALGWGKQVKFDHEFLGRAALEKVAANPGRARVTLEWSDEDIIEVYASLFQRETEPYDFLEFPNQPTYCVWADRIEDEDGNLIGTSTVPGYSIYFRHVLTLSYIDPAFAEPGTPVWIVWGAPGHPQKRVRATVKPAPYKQDRRRAPLVSAPPSA